jgi:hypothetical protein
MDYLNRREIMYPRLSASSSVGQGWRSISDSSPSSHPVVVSAGDTAVAWSRSDTPLVVTVGRSAVPEGCDSDILLFFREER